MTGSRAVGRRTPPTDRWTQRGWVVVLLMPVALGGVVLASAGLAVAVRFVSKDGWSLTPVVGVLVAGVGLLVLAGSVRGAWRRSHGWWRLWFVPGLMVCLVVVWVTLTAVVATLVPPTPLGADTPQAHGLIASSVTFPTPDGVQLSAWYAPSTDGAAVVLLHGSGENRTATLPQAQVLAAHGYGVLLVDARGHGDSRGRGMDFGWYGDQDVRGAVDFLARQPDVDPQRIGLLGLSMGGEEAIGAAVADPRIAAVVAEGATNRTAADKAAWLPGSLAGKVQRAIDRLAYGLTDLLAPAAPPTALVDAIAQARAPFLLITAGTVADETLAANALQHAAPTRVTVWTVPRASHTHALQEDPAAWEHHVIAFFETAMHNNQ